MYPSCKTECGITMPPNKGDEAEINETTSLVNAAKKSHFPKTSAVKVASSQRKCVVLIACFVLQIVANGIGFGLSVMYVEIMQTFGATRSKAALVQSLYMAIMTAGGIVWTPLIRKYGPGICLFVGCVTACIGLFGSYYSTSIETIIVLTGLIASFGMSVGDIVSFITTSALFREDAGVAIIFLTTGSSIGQFIFPCMIDIFISNYGWNGAFILLGGIALQCAPASCIIYESREFMTKSDTCKSQLTGCAAMCNFDWTLLESGIILFVLSDILLLAFTGHLEAWFLVDIMTLRGYEREIGSIFMSVVGLSNVLGRLTSVLLRLKVIVPTVYHWLYCMPALAISHALVQQFVEYWPSLIAYVLYGYVFGIVTSQLPVIILEIAGIERYAEGMAFVNLFFGAGCLLSGSIGGMIKDNYGTYDPMFYIAISGSVYIAFSAVIIASIVRRRQREQHDVPAEGQSTLRYERIGNGED